MNITMTRKKANSVPKPPAIAPSLVMGGGPEATKGPKPADLAASRTAGVRALDRFNNRDPRLAFNRPQFPSVELDAVLRKVLARIA